VIKPRIGPIIVPINKELIYLKIKLRNLCLFIQLDKCVLHWRKETELVLIFCGQILIKCTNIFLGARGSVFG
jgi:hypothetical protein